MYMYVCVHMGKLGPIMAHQPIGGTQFWAHNEPWASLGHHGPWGAQVWAHNGPWASLTHHGPWEAQVWAHNGPWASLGPSWPKGGPKFEPIMGRGQV